MATSTFSKPVAKGGSFLLESPAPQDVFTPADLTDDQRLIGQTAEEFVVKEVFPVVKDLEAKKPGLLPQLVKKAAELGAAGLLTKPIDFGLLRGEIDQRLEQAA